MLRILSRRKATETRIVQIVEIRIGWIRGIIAYADRTAREVFAHSRHIISPSV